jgi:predicted hydrolase (HD superfamily)
MINRSQYIQALQQQLEPNIVKHSLALEACMGALYDYLAKENKLSADEPSKTDWMLAGLMHDIDFGGEFKEFHPAKTKEAFAKYSLPLDGAVYGIIQAHAGGPTMKRINKAQWAIYCADSLTGLITAVALIYPTKKLADVKLKSVMKRFLKEPRFAAGTRRDEIAQCSDPSGLDMPLETFIQVCLQAMQATAPDLGL